MDLETLLSIPYVYPYTGFAISPDGACVAFSWNPTGQWEIYLAPLDGSVPPRPVTAGAGAKFAPRWSPNGRRLAYALDLNGDESFDIYVYDLDTNQHINLTPDTPDAIQHNFDWSPDGSCIAFISDRSGHFNTYVMDIARDSSTALQAGPARLALDFPHPDWEVYWSPDGRWLAVIMEGLAQDFWTAVVPAEGGEPRLIGSPMRAEGACWSPDSTRIAFASDLDGFLNLGIYELATGQITWATQGSGDKEQPAWSPDGRRLAYVAGNGPTTALAVVELDGGPPTIYQIEPGVCYLPRFTPDGASLLFVFDSPCRPSDLWLLSPNDGSFRQLTCSLPADLDDSPFAAPTQVRYPSLDGRSVPTLLYEPVQAEELPPAVVYVHGGPDWLTQCTWDPVVQHMVSRGWIVLAPNYRGSTGYGQEWQLANRFDLGNGDTQDVVAGADYLVREGLADPSRIAITGRSWGGYLTMSALTRYPDRWAAGSAVVPFLNWFTGHANSRPDLRHWDMENLGDPAKDHALYYERSPFFFLDRIVAPVQLICGAHDVRCPASESTQAHAALVAQEKECDLVLYEDEGHSFLKLENVVDAEQRRVAFLAQVFESEAKQVDRLFAKWNRADSPGCALGVIRDGQWVYKRGYGMANLEHDIPISPQTVFRIASASKQFTAMCIALLAEQGKLALDDDVRKYLPELPEYKRPITIRHLIHHTSGLRDYLELMELAGARDEDFYTDDQVIEMLARQKELNFTPGDEYLYSNTGYYLLGVIVRRVSGRPLREFAEMHIFRPLGMTNTHFHDDHTEIVKRRAVGYSPRDDDGYRINMTALDMVGDGGIFTTIEDLFLWDQNFYHNQLGKGSNDLIRQVTTPGVLNDGQAIHYAFGLAVDDYRGLKTVSHGGAFVGYRSEMIRFPEQAFTVICLSNLSTFNPERLARQVAEIYLANQFKAAAAKVEPVELPPEALEDKVGVYWSADAGIVVTLAVQDGRLTVEMGGETAALAPVGERDFVAAAPFDVEIEFERHEQHGAWLMRLRGEDGNPITLQAIETVQINADPLAEYAGDYYSEELQATYKLALVGGALYIRHRSAPEAPLQPGFRDMFWTTSTTLLFDRDDQGRISGFRISTGRVRNIYFHATRAPERKEKGGK
jgi:dipeptidyl aminopeptidase/acylaminoacyl peptidase/CubicO group peptidase (beta-lactamase class C family)